MNPPASTLPRIRVLVASRVRLIRDGLAAMLSQRPRVSAVESAECVERALDAVAAFAPTIILLDVATPDGLDIAQHLAAASPATPILAFSASEEDHDVLAYAEAGISGFVPREASTDDLFSAMERMVRGELLCSPHIAWTLFRRLGARGPAAARAERPGALTQREREIMRAVDAGLSNKEIAARLRISVSTVKNHVHSVLEKLRVSRRGEAVARLRHAPARVVPELATDHL